MTDHQEQGHVKPELVQESIRVVIEILHDGHKGFADIGHQLKDPEAKRFFLQETQTRSEFAAELENELHRMGVHDVKEGGTAAGALHRVWGDLKAKLGGGDHTLLDTAEQGEDVAKKAYAKVLKEKLPEPLREMLTKQQAHIHQVHDKVRALRDSKAA
ncbi:MAG TPA: PA2169 family four-helix-bundle protein [Acidobacteriaceae bacterium]|nr:PA2169 family four-helix-bundle protein [Acidobacteriaceae bacterium]